MNLKEFIEKALERARRHNNNMAYIRGDIDILEGL